jgi:hypothetical protein
MTQHVPGWPIPGTAAAELAAEEAARLAAQQAQAAAAAATRVHLRCGKLLAELCVTGCYSSS